MARQSKRASRVFALLLSGLAASVLLAWYAGVPLLTSWGGGLDTRPLTAGCLLALALRQLATERLSLPIRATISGIVATVGLIVVLQHVTGTNIRVLDWLVPHGSVPEAGRENFRMSQGAAASLLLAGSAMMIKRGVVATVARLASGFIIGVIALLGTVGFDILIENFKFSSIARPTSAGLLLLSGMLISSGLGRGVPLPLYAALSLMLACALVPTLLLALTEATRASSERREAVLEEGRGAASRAGLFVERFIADRTILLRTLAASPALQSNDLAAFYEHARTLAALPESAIVVIDRSINQVMSTGVPFGTSLPPVADPATARKVFDTQAVEFSDLFLGPFSRQPIVSVVAPVPGNAYVLRLTSSSRWLSEQLQREAPPGWVLTVVDRQGTIVARSSEADRLVGFKVPDENWKRAVDQRTGYIVRSDGERRFFVLHETSMGWSTVANAEAQPIVLDVRSPLKRFAQGLLAMAGLTALIAWIATGVLARPLKRLAANVRSYTNYRLAPSLIVEVNAVANAWHEAALTRESHEKALQERRQLEALGRLTGGVAHDFNNILAIVEANLELIQLRVDDESVDRYIAEVTRATQMGARLNRRLMTFAQRRQLEPEHVDLNEFVSSSLDMLRSAVGSSITVDARLGSSSPVVRVDLSELENSIINLALNAREAMPNGGNLVLATYDFLVDAVEAETRGIKPGQYVGLAASDTGIGMTQEVRSKAFVPFFTTKVGQVAGLGLATVHGFVKQSAGDITLKSEVGKGTTVDMLFPVAADMASTKSQTI